MARHTNSLQETPWRLWKSTCAICCCRTAGRCSRLRAVLKSWARTCGLLRRRLSQYLGEVEDLVQETLLAIHNQRHTYRPDMPVTAWAHAIARYKLIDWLRSHRVKEALNDPLDDAGELFASSDEEAAEARRDLGQLLQTLPDRQRLPIVREAGGAVGGRRLRGSRGCRNRQ